MTVIDWSGNTEYIWSLPTVAAYTCITLARGTLRGLFILINQSRVVRPEVAIIYGYQDVALFLVAALLRLLGVRTLSMNDSKFDDYRRRWWRDFIKVLLLMPYHGFLVASQRSADYMYYLRGSLRTLVYHCAIDTARVRAASRAVFEATAFADRDFLMIGRFADKKNHLILLDIYARYAAASPRPRRLRLIGYGPLEQEIRTKIAASPLLSRLVAVEGYVPAADMPSKLGSSLALLLPSKEEQFGIVITEALAAGIPVIVSPSCGAADLVDVNVNGFIVEPNNVEGWIETMSILDGDGLLWHKMSESTTRYAERADVSVFVQAVGTLANGSPGNADGNPAAGV